VATRESTVRLSVADNFSQALAKYVQAIIQGEVATGKLATTLDQTEKANAKVAKSTQPLTDAWEKYKSAVVPATAVLVGFGVALKQAFAAGQEGAEIAQTRESFATMLDVIGAGPGLLQELRTAARGTVDDLTLMSSVQLLLAGTSGELSTRFAEATPQLLEMALAARKINPALGDTQFLFDSIARGIKRSSPLILDNLGIVVKLGPAYKDYADSIGKATDELTAEEKQIALLNAVLAKSDTLMAQAGGSTAIAGEQMALLTTNAKNAAQEFKENLYPSVEAVATALNALLFGPKTIDDALEQHAADVSMTARSYEAYVEEVLRARVAAGELTASWVTQNRELLLTGQASDNLMRSLGLLSRAQFYTNRETSEAKKVLGQLSVALADNGRQWKDAGDEMEIAGKKAGAAGKQIGDAIEKISGPDLSLGIQFEAATRYGANFADELGELVKKLGQYQAANGAVIPPAQNLSDLLLDAAIAADDYNERVEKLAAVQKELAENTDPDKQGELEREMRRAERAVRDAAAAMGDADSAANGAAGGVANYSGAIDKTREAIHNMLAEAFAERLLEQLGALADLAAAGEDTAAAYQRTYDALVLVNPELAAQFELSSSVAGVQDTLNDALYTGAFNGEQAATAYSNFTAALAAGADPLAAAEQAIFKVAWQTKQLPPDGTTWNYYVRTVVETVGNMYGDAPAMLPPPGSTPPGWGGGPPRETPNGVPLPSDDPETDPNPIGPSPTGTSGPPAITVNIATAATDAEAILRQAAGAARRAFNSGMSTMVSA
jgi:hypothetical protein